MAKVLRSLPLVVLTAVLYAGPVAACFCAEDSSMAAMPCCPEQPAYPDLAQLGVPADVAVACAPAPGKVLLFASIELPEPAAIAPRTPLESTGLDPPRSMPPMSTRAFSSEPPLYLTTLRLRI